MPKGCKAKKRKPAAEDSELTTLRLRLARHSGLLARICSFHRLSGDTDNDRFDSVVQFFKEKEEDQRNRPAAF